MDYISKINDLVANLNVKGTQEFMGKEIPVVEGGFGESKRCLTDKTIAEIHGMRDTDIRRRINDNIKRFKNKIDFIDLKSCAYDAQQLKNIGYTNMQISKAEHIYLLSERGYAKLIKIMDTDLAWEIHDKLIDEYFAMRKVINSSELTEKQMLQLQILNGSELERVGALKQYEEVITKPLQETIQTQSNTIGKLVPLANFANSVQASKQSILVGELAKLLKQNGVDIGQNRLFVWLRENGYLIKRKGSSYNMPTQKSMDLGLFEIKETCITHADGHTSISKTPKVTGKGQIYFVNKFKRVS